MVRRALRIVAMNTYASTTDQIGRIWQQKGIFKGCPRALTLPMSHHKYNESLDMVEIGIWCLYNGHHKLFLHHEWGQMWPDPHSLLTPRSNVFVLTQAFHSNLTLHQCLIIGIINGQTRLRLEFIAYSHHR